MKTLTRLVTGFALFFLMTTFVFAARTILTYKQLFQTLDQGRDVKAIIHFDQCRVQASSPELKQSIEGASTRTNFSIYSNYKIKDKKGDRFAVATSMTILTDHSLLGAVYAYGRLRVFEDDTAEFHTAYYDAKTMSLKGSVDYQCNIYDGAVVLIDTSV